MTFDEWAASINPETGHKRGSVVSHDIQREAWLASRKAVEADLAAANALAEKNEKGAGRYRWLRDEATQDQLYKMCDWPDVEWDDVIDDASSAHD